LHLKDPITVEDEQVFLKLFKKNLISFKRLQHGEIVGSGLLNPLLDKFSLFTMLYFQARFYKKYDNLARWKGKIVANPFAPPVGSRPQFRGLKNLAKTHLLGRAFPLAMTFAVNYRCQCSCVHCSADRHIRTDRKELSTEEAKRLLDDSMDMGICIVAFTGGEPLLRKDIFDLISHVDHSKTMPIMFTNGQYLTDENADKLAEAGLYTIFVSLDSPCPQEHDRMRGMPGLFDKAVKGLEKMKSRGVLVGISSYAGRSGTEKGTYKEMYRLGKDLGVHTILLFDCVPTGRLLKDTSDVITIKQREEIAEYSSQIFENKLVPSLSSQSWQNSLEGYMSGIGCLAGNIQYYVSAYGDVAPCDFAPLSFGNIREEPLKKIWKKIVKHPAYNHRNQYCRMQHPDFRKIYIDPIPDDAYLPYPIDNLSKEDYRKTKVRH
jgi:MoaA/NifB/PqqE/SkfB family radical SAM enzyme